MSDDFAICPRCRKFDATFYKEGEKLKCTNCDAVFEFGDILWKHIPYEERNYV